MGELGGRLLVVAALTAGCGSPSDEGWPGSSADWSGEEGRVSQVRFALTKNVPGDFPTIQQALNAAASGDTVAVQAGEFKESLVLKSGVNLVGAGAGKTVLVGAITVDNVTGATVEGLTVKHDGAHSAGIVGWNAGITVKGCIIEGWPMGVDVGSAPGTSVRFVGNKLRNNGQAMFVSQGHLAEVYSNLLVFNKSGAIDCDSHQQNIIAGNTLVANGTEEEEAQIAMPDSSCGGEIRENIIVAGAIGLYCPGCALARSKNDVWGNATNYAGTTKAETDISVDPKFVSAGESDFRLDPSSPCVNAGGSTGEPTVDIDGTPRPQGPAREIGAYEVGVSGSTLVITEVMTNPMDEATGEYVELVNVGSVAVDAAGLVLSDGDAVDVVVGWKGGPTAVVAGGYAVILDKDYAGQYQIPGQSVLLTVGDKTLGNGLAVNDPVTLYEKDGKTTIDSYGFPFDPGNGVSAQRLDPLAPDAPGNWTPCGCSASPGAADCPGPPPQVKLLFINEVMANPKISATGEFVEVYNAGNVAMDLAGYTLSDGDESDVLAGYKGAATVLGPGKYALLLDPDFAGDYVIPAGVVLLVPSATTAIGNGLSKTDPVTLIEADGATVASSYTSPLPTTAGVSVEKIITNGPDQQGNWAPSPCPTGSSPGASNCAASPATGPKPTLALTEVMANPIVEDTQEFLEIYNHGEAPVDAAGLKITDGDAFDTLTGWKGGSTLIPAKGTGVVLDPEYVPGTYAIPADAVLLTVKSSTNLGSGLATDDPVRLLLGDGATLLDSFLAPFNPGNGVSAQRLDPLAADTPANWAPSACPKGSSPGKLKCGTPVTYTATWVDRDHSEGGHTWWRAIGYPHHFDPDNIASSCELVTVCPGSPSGLTYQDNLAAPVSFSFTNPYDTFSVTFYERAGPSACFECGGAALTVGPKETKTIPASSLGYYHASVEQHLNGADYEFSFYWDPPPDVMMPAFQVTVEQ